MEIDPSARKHGVSDADMIHAYRHHWKAFSTADHDVTMYVGPGLAAQPLEVAVIDDDEGVAIIHAMPAREKFLKGWWTR